ncbi:MAG: acyl-CoA desaturase [Planctomycetes bacterium]|nr:acyl-CoA desaturase [Planctomycetota bacterium]
MNQVPAPRGVFKSIFQWFCPPKQDDTVPQNMSERLDWGRLMPFIAMHLACLLVFFVGWSWLAISIAVFLYALRVFTLTGFYHRYFSHRAFKTSRLVQFIFAAIGCSAVQRGPLWWAAHHRHHHKTSDEPDDLHSPKQKGIFWAHMAWFLTPRAQRTNLKLIPDFAKYPELRFLDRFDLVMPVLLALSLFGFGELVALGAPESGVTGFQLLVWGFFISTIACYHVTYLVNSATHLIGTRRYETKDDSKNSLVVALLTFGEGWHNNHHYYPNSTRQGFFWWEIDLTFYVLTFMSKLGLVWDLKGVPERILYPKPKAAPEPIPMQAEPVTVHAS